MFNLIINFIINIKMLFFRRKQPFSLQRFYEIKQSQSQLLPQLPEDVVFSKYLTKIQSQKNNALQPISETWKIKNKQLSYSQLLSGSPYGSIQNFSFKGVSLTLASTNYHRLQSKKLHKLLFKTNPSAIIVQKRPQYYLRNFQLLPKGQNDVFSDLAYLQQLKINSKDIRPPEKSNSPLVNALNKNIDEGLQKNPQKEILKVKGFETVYNYAASYSPDLYLGQIPNRVFRQWIVNSHTLMQLQEMFKNICRRLPRYKTFQFTPYQLGTLIYPQIFLKLNDHYMATVIEMMVATKKYKNIVGVFGILENSAVRQMLESQKSLDPIIDILIAPKPKGSILRDIQNFQILEKHILMDVLFYGEELLNVKMKYLHTTNAIIQKYCRQIPAKTTIEFRFNKIHQYIDLLKTKIQQGQEQIKKQFVRQTLRS